LPRISRERQVPTQLPPGDIFLDDITEIVEIVETEFNYAQEQSASEDRPKSISFAYEVDKEYTFSTIADLAAHGGKTSQFSLNAIIESGVADWVRSSVIPVIEFRGSSPVAVRAPYEIQDRKWSIFAKIEQVFADRRSRFRSLGRVFPPLSLLPFGYVPVFLLLLIYWLVPARIIKPFFVVEAAGALLYLLALLLAFYTDNRENYVLLRYRREAGQERVKARKETLGRFGWLLLAASAGAVLKPIAEWIFTKVKH